MTFTPATISGSILDFLDGVQSARVTGVRLEGGVSDGDDARLGGLDVQYSATKTTTEPVVATGTYAIVIQRLAGGQPFKKRSFTAPITADTSWGEVLSYDGTGYEYTPDELARLVAVEQAVEDGIGGAVPDATTTVHGKVELATNAETTTGTDTTRAVTPAGLAAALSGLSNYDDTDLLAAIADLTDRVAYLEENGGGGGGVDPGDTTAPSVPTGLAHTATSNTITLTWSASTDDVAVDSYDVRLLDEDDAQVGIIHNVLASTFTTREWTFTSLATATDYTAQVRAIDSSGNTSAWASHAAATAGSGVVEDTFRRWALNEGAGSTSAEADGKTALTLSANYTWGAGHTGAGLRSGNTVGAVTSVWSPKVNTAAWAGVTIMLWASLDSAGGPGMLLYGSRMNDKDDEAWPLFRFERTGSAGIVSGIKSWLNLSAGAPFDVSDFLTSTFTPVTNNSGEFHHYAVTWDAATGVWTNYFDGASVGTRTKTGTFQTSTPESDKGLGGVGFQNTNVLPATDSGFRDDIRIFPRALTTGEIVTFMGQPVV